LFLIFIREWTGSWRIKAWYRLCFDMFNNENRKFSWFILNSRVFIEFSRNSCEFQFQKKCRRQLVHSFPAFANRNQPGFLSSTVFVGATLYDSTSGSTFTTVFGPISVSMALSVIIAFNFFFLCSLSFLLLIGCGSASLLYT